MMRYRLATIVVVISFLALTGCARAPVDLPQLAGSKLATMNSQLDDLVRQIEGLNRIAPKRQRGEQSLSSWQMTPARRRPKAQNAIQRWLSRSTASRALRHGSLAQT